MDDVLARLLADLPSTALLAYLVYSLVRLGSQLLEKHQANIDEAVGLLREYLALMEAREAREND